MTDIVERLQYYTPYGPITDMQADAIMKEAADEIERLRAENQELKLQYLSDQGQWIEETGRLRDALSAMTELFKATEASAQVALSEIERLREALERKQRPEAETIDGVIAWIKEDAERLAKARAALGEKE